MTATPPPGPHDQEPSGAPPGPWATDYRSPVAPPPERPQSIVTAVKLMYVGAALSLLGMVVSFFQTDQIRDALRDGDPSLTESQLDNAVAGTLAFGTVIGLVGVGVWIWMAYANGQGKRWARTTATVLGALNVVFTLIGLGGMTERGSLSTIIGLIGALVAAVIIYLLWRSESSRYYEANTAR